MRVLGAVALTILVSFAGCLSSNSTTPDSGAGMQIPVTEGDAQQPFATFLCKDGYVAAGGLTAANLDRCNHRVTKPLLDASRLDVVGQHGPANEVSIAMNPTNILNAAGGAKDYTVSYVSDDAGCGEFTVWMGTYATFDGGLTWSNDLMPGFPGDDRPSPLSGNGCNTDPVLVFDDDGTLYYSGLNYRGARDDLSTIDFPGTEHDAVTGSQVYFARSQDGGASYDRITFTSFGDNDNVFNDKQWFAAQAGGDHMILTWSDFIGPGPVILYSESLDAGATWTPPRPIPGANALTVLAVQDSMPQYFTGPAGEQRVAATWVSTGVKASPHSEGPESVIAYAEGIVTPAGVQWIPATAAFSYNPVQSGPGRDGSGPSTFRWGTIPVLAVDTIGGACDGRRYVVWEDQPGPLDSDVNVLLRYSDDGVAWSMPLRVSYTGTGDQLMPWIETDEEGGVHVAYYDRRNDPDNRLLDVYYAYSEDCAETFLPDIRVTEASFDGDLGHHQNGSPFIGDYIGMDATSEAAMIIWADTRHTGSPGREAGSDVYTATILRDLDVRAQFDAVFSEPRP